MEYVTSWNSNPTDAVFTANDNYREKGLDSLFIVLLQIIYDILFNYCRYYCIIYSSHLYDYAVKQD